MSLNIKHILKIYEGEIFIIVTLILVVLSLYFAISIAINASEGPNLRIERMQDGGLVSESSAQLGLLVGSKNGSKYHHPWCSGGKRIKEVNKLWFDSVEDAKRAGYAPAKNCKGLE